MEFLRDLGAATGRERPIMLEVLAAGKVFGMFGNLPGGPVARQRIIIRARGSRPSNGIAGGSRPD
ncbi:MULTISPECIES: hypothetical protein [unclassified Sphingopyxis]|uniref:hypothetical protein n=1 Tax=unclassified Sphingopyxis TaxID=2614943 RepID=UPI0024AD9B3E|nr:MULTISPECIES: hypothetical protein [unclassified Sphingopyxis]